MRRKNREVISELEQQAPPVPATEALKKNLLHIMIEQIKDRGTKKMVEALLDKADNGDLKADALVIEILRVANATPQPSGNVYMQQAFVGNAEQVQFLSDTRRQIVALIAAEGPLESPQIASKIHALLPDALTALNNHDWFEKESDGWHITQQARAEVLAITSD